MLAFLLHDTRKKVRFGWSFVRRRMIHVNLQILYDCNYRCRICDFWKDTNRGRARLSARQAEVISEKLNERGPQIVSIGGGEPMLHPELVGIVKALARYHFPVMITNGSLVTPELARNLFEAGMVEISVSLDYVAPEKHDAQRGVAGAARRAIEALKILHANRTHPEQRVNMISVLLEDNLPDLEPLLKQCQDMGITYLLTLYSHSRGSKAEHNFQSQVGEHLLSLKKRYPEFVALRGYLEKFSTAIAHNGIGPCYAGKNLCNIDSQGNVTLCIDRLEDVIGNILEEDFLEIEQRLRTRQANNSCQACWTSCRGSIESVLYGRQPGLNLYDYYQMTRPVPLGGRF